MTSIYEAIRRVANGENPRLVLMEMVPDEEDGGEAFDESEEEDEEESGDEYEVEDEEEEDQEEEDEESAEDDDWNPEDIPVSEEG